MLLYLFYNADLLDMARGLDEKSLGYVDNIAFMATANSFMQMHSILKSMMLWAQGGFHWSEAHNSKFETSKSMLMDLSRSKSAIHPPLSIRGMTIATVSTHKFLGVMLDQELRWGPQANYMVAKATKWTLTYRRLARPSMGIRPRLMQQLYNAVAVPKMVYAADVWYTPVYLCTGRERHCGSVGITSRLASVQCLASTTIMGALCSTATDVLDLHANLLPVEPMLHKVCQRAAVRLTTLPASHPLSAPFKTQAKHFIKTHWSPLHELAFIYDISPSSFETLAPARALPRHRNKFTMVPFGTEEESIE